MRAEKRPSGVEKHLAALGVEKRGARREEFRPRLDLVAAATTTLLWAHSVCPYTSLKA